MGFAVELTDAVGAEEAMAGLELMGRSRDDAVGRGRPWVRPGPVVPGPVLFARYAFPPNSHGFCGPADSGSFFEYGVAGRDDGGLRAMAQQFAGAWPYLELIAGATGLTDPLDRRVVEAYWIGSPRLDAGGHPRGRRLDGGPVPVPDRGAVLLASPRGCSPGECRTTASPSSASIRTPAC